MTQQIGDIVKTGADLEALKRTLLYEGYALFPYNRSAIKNQKPIPFGVVFPKNINRYDQHAHASMQSECILKGTNDLFLNIEVCFLHLKQIELFQIQRGKEGSSEEMVSVSTININGTFYQAGWQTIERKICTRDLPITALLEEQKLIPFVFPGENKVIYIKDEQGCTVAKQTACISQIIGNVTIAATAIKNHTGVFKLSVKINNNTPVVNAENVSRNEVQGISFLSTHIIFYSKNGSFISHQDPGEQWNNLIAGCVQENAWPILIGEKDNVLLASPIILYDHPVIHPQSNGDLFDSTEIEEALLLHVSVLSDDEKDRIAQADDKLKTMLNKVSQLTPQELVGFHSGLKPVNNLKSTPINI